MKSLKRFFSRKPTNIENDASDDVNANDNGNDNDNVNVNDGVRFYQDDGKMQNEEVQQEVNDRVKESFNVHLLSFHHQYRLKKSFFDLLYVLSGNRFVDVLKTGIANNAVFQFAVTFKGPACYIKVRLLFSGDHSYNSKDPAKSYFITSNDRDGGDFPMTSYSLREMNFQKKTFHDTYIICPKADFYHIYNIQTELLSNTVYNFYFIRHGAASHNVKGGIKTELDTDIIHKEQVIEAGKFFYDYFIGNYPNQRIHGIGVSDLYRTIATAQAFLVGFQHDILSPFLKEITVVPCQYELSSTTFKGLVSGAGLTDADEENLVSRTILSGNAVNFQNQVTCRTSGDFQAENGKEILDAKNRKRTYYTKRHCDNVEFYIAGQLISGNFKVLRLNWDHYKAFYGNKYRDQLSGINNRYPVKCSQTNFLGLFLRYLDKSLLTIAQANSASKVKLTEQNLIAKASREQALAIPGIQPVIQPVIQPEEAPQKEEFEFGLLPHRVSEEETKQDDLDEQYLNKMGGKPQRKYKRKTLKRKTLKRKTLKRKTLKRKTLKRKTSKRKHLRRKTDRKKI
jgi:hypothetical protein